MSTTQSFLYLQQPSNLSRFGLWVGYFFSINVVIGSGFLSLPYSFNRSGWLLGLIFMIFTALQTYYISRQLIESMSKIECAAQLEEVGMKVEFPTFKQIYFQSVTPTSLTEEITPTITDRRFDISTMVSLVFGRKYGIAYLVLLYVGLTGSQTAYISIFSTSFSAIVPLGFRDTCNIYEDSEFFGGCRVNYWVYMSIYGICMMYITVKGLREQRWMQSALTVVRFLVIGLILITCIALIAGESNIKNDKHVPVRVEQPVNIRNLLGTLPNILFAFIYQTQFPSIAEFIHDKKKNLKRIAFMVGATSFVLYALVAIIVPIAIHDVRPQCNIEYSDYSAGYSQSQRPWWTYIIAYFIILFPAFDVFSSFPLMAVAVSDNLITINAGGTNEDFADPIKQRNYRIFSVIPPFVISIFWFNLSEIINWIGITLFIVVPITLPMLHTFIKEAIPEKSAYDVPFYNKWLNLAISVFNTILLIAVCYGNIFPF